MRGEDHLGGHAPARLGHVDSLGFHAPADELERRKCAVSLVQVHHSGRDAERRQRLRAADTQQQFLADPDSLVAAVQPGGQLPILGAVAFDIRVEKQQHVPPDVDAPDARDDATGSRFDRDGHRNTVPHGGLNRQQTAVDVDVVLLLPAVGIEPLTKISLVVIETDTHERDAEIGRALEVIAGQDAEPARVDRERLMKAELGGEIRDRPRAEHAGMLRSPRVLRLQVLLHPSVGVVDAPVQRQLRGASFQLCDRHLLEQDDRIVIALAPQHGIELPEQAYGLLIPRPPDVLREGREPLMHRRHEVPHGAGLADNRCELSASRG